MWVSIVVIYDPEALIRQHVLRLQSCCEELGVVDLISASSVGCLDYLRDLFDRQTALEEGLF